MMTTFLNVLDTNIIPEKEELRWQQAQAAAWQYAQTVTSLHAQMQADNLSENQYHAAVAGEPRTRGDDPSGP